MMPYNMKCDKCHAMMKEKDPGNRHLKIKTYICPNCHTFANVDNIGSIKWYDCNGNLFSPTSIQRSTSGKA